MKKIYIICMLLFAMLFVSCKSNIGAYEYFEQDEITINVIEKIDELDRTIFNSIVNSNFDDIRNRLTKSAFYNPALLGEGNSENSFVQSTEFENLWHTYVVIHDKNPNISISIPLANGVYIFNKETQYRECVISLNRFQVNEFEYLLILFYVKDKGEWRIDYVDFPYYSTYSLTVDDMYKKTMELSEMGHFEASLIYIDYIEHMLINYKYIQLSNSGEIRANNNLVQQKANFPLLPQIIDGVDVYRFYCYPRENGIEITIQYTTEIDVTNPSEKEKMSLEEEAHIIHESLMYIYTYLENEFTTFRYQACNEIPYSRVKNYDNYETYIDR